MAFTHKDWKDDPDSSTPLSAAALENLEDRLAAYTDTVGAAATPADGSVTAAKVNAALKPSGSAAAGTEALRALGTTASTAAAGNDSRLSDARTPTDGTVTAAKVAASLKPSGSAVSTDESLRALGTTSSTAAAGNHSHAASAISVTPSGAMGSTDVQSALVEAFTELSGGGGSSAPTIQGTAAGNLGTAQTVAFASTAAEIWLVGVLNGNLAVTVTNPIAGSRLKVLALQDGTGGRTLTIAGTAVTIASTASTGLAMVTVDWVDATNFRIESAGVFTESDPLAVLKSLGTTKGDVIAFTASGTPARLGVGSDGQVLKAASGQSSGLQWAADTGFANPMTTSGDVIYGGASGAPTRLAKGSDGQVLKLASGVPTWAADATGGGGGGGHALAMAAGRLYLPPQYAGSTNHSQGNNRALAVPFMVARACTVTQVAIMVTVVGSTGTRVRVGIYTDGGGFPGSLVSGSDSGQIDVTSGTDVKTATIAAALSTGTIYWIVEVQQGATAGNVSLKGTNVGGFNPLIPSTTDNLGLGVGLIWDDASFAAALPSTAGSSGDWTPSTAAPTIALLAAA